MDPLIRAWAVPPTLHISGLRATERVTARNSVFTCDQHATTDTESAKTQTHSAKTGLFRRFSPNGAALWRPHHRKPRPRRHQSGGIALHGGSTRRRHAARRLRVVQNPHRHQPEVRHIATRPGRSIGRREKVRPTPPLHRLFREKTRPASAKTLNLGQFERTGRTFSRFHDLTATQGELFRARRRRPSSALPISDRAPQVWRAPGSGGPEGLAAVPVGGGITQPQTNFACNSPTTRIDARSKTAEYQRLDFNT